MVKKNPVKKVIKKAGCGVCIHKTSELKFNEEEPGITRVYCKARHFDVDIDLMNRDCDFFTWDQSKAEPETTPNIEYGL